MPTYSETQSKKPLQTEKRRLSDSFTGSEMQAQPLA